MAIVGFGEHVRSLTHSFRQRHGPSHTYTHTEGEREREGGREKERDRTREG